MEDKNNPILEHSFNFALNVIVYCELLEDGKKFVIARQLLKSGTSIGANISEAQSSESKADFIHKLKIAEKECAETDYWLRLCKHSENYPNCDLLLESLLPIQKLLSKIISTTIKNKNS
jgi:four helix bundle protein